MAPIATPESASLEKSLQNGDYSRPFHQAPINLYPEVGEESTSTRTLPELIEFNAAANPNHLFCIQATKAKGAFDLIHITNYDLRNAITNCQIWLKNNIVELKTPTRGENSGMVEKGAPIALLMESDVGLFIYKLALIGMGVPVLLLSARLSATAVHHLLKTTCAVAILSSHSLQSIADQAKDLMTNDEISLSVYAPNPYITFLSRGISPKSTQKSAQSICYPNHYLNESDRSVLILHSSGTTGLPKPIYVSHRHLMCFTTCHAFVNEEASGLNLSTLPLYHGFGLIAPALAMGVGKTVCFPPTSSVPNALLVIELLKTIHAASLMTVPSILEDISLLKDSEGIKVLSKLDFVTFGGGILKSVVGDQLFAAGVRLLNHYGTTESGPLAPIFVPKSGYNWRFFRLREDIKMTITEVASSMEGERRFTLTTYPFGWDEPFEIQDQLICNPEHPDTDFNVVGRNDDWIVLATGEKVLPQILESMLVESGLLKSAIAFGEHRSEIGVIVEPSEPTSEEHFETLKKAIWPVIIRAGEQMDGHAKITSVDSIIVVPAGRAIPRTDKGSIARKEVYKAFEVEIDRVYELLESIHGNWSANLFFSDPANFEAGLKQLIQTELSWSVPFNSWTYEDDLFELGMDSLQATRLRRCLLSLGPVVGGSQPLSEKISRDFLYANPSIQKISQALRESPGTVTMSKSMLLVQQIDSLINEHSLKASPATAVVLLTGATGSLGCHCLAKLLLSSHVSRVVCLNRPGKDRGESPILRQKRAIKNRGVNVSDEFWSKVTVYEADSSAEFLGLSKQEYATILSTVTHIVHAAWPMDFKWKLSSFQAQFCTLNGLLHVAREAHQLNPSRKSRVLFISSIATVGQYASVHNKRIIPEVPTDNIYCANDIGYAQAKLVCERIIERAVANSGDMIEASYIRLGQVAGARNTGHWNVHEHIPALFKSSQQVGALPLLGGTLSWMPVDDVANVISELALAPGPLKIVYHIENPVRQAWNDVLHIIGRDLDLQTFLPFEEWLGNVSSHAEGLGEENPAKGLLEFFRGDFIRMACGQVIMATDETRKVSRTMSNMDSLQEEDITCYVQFWKRVGYLD